jgi:hypothetical protein
MIVEALAMLPAILTGIYWAEGVVVINEYN